jgi:methenyltetrahydromethanopterin cyclohydrolase
MATDLNQRAARLARSLSKSRVIDLGVERRGSLSEGVMLARICMADLADVQLVSGSIAGRPLPLVTVSVREPVAACMASQYAGWRISVDKFFAMGSGPFRAIYGREKLYNDIGHRETADVAVGVLETGSLPDDAVIDWVADKLNMEASRIILLCARTASLAGGVQIAARSVETAMHKLHELGFGLHRVVSGFGSAPLPPVAKDDMAAIGRTNDAVLYGAQVTLFVTGDDDTLRDAGEQLPSSASRDYGKPFGEVFAGYDHDFYKIDPMLFSPAEVMLHNIDTGRVHHFGKVNHDILAQSFFA